uniref:RING-type domain-containing protein n=1 Tax=viral metagenome TaxID=1070528 RepID=A0A6C0J2Y7_9ZZZZ
MAYSRQILNMMRDILETDRFFYQAANGLSESARARVLLSSSRNTGMMMDLLHRVLTMNNQSVTTSVPLFTMSIPIPETFEDVPIVATPAQINHAIIAGTHVESVCAVCQETVGEGCSLRKCAHSFHTNCIRSWFSMSARCPVCRDDIREV